MHNGATSGGAQTGKEGGLKHRCPKGLVGSTPTRRIWGMRPLAEYAEAWRLKGAGLNSCEISRATGIPRSTVREWLANGPPKTMSRVGQSMRRLGGTFPWLEHHAYTYLLGMYLGDGHIVAMRRGVYHLRIYLDPKRTYRYPRYEFSNRSDDICGIFCEYCDLVGVEWRVMNRWTISVARRESVAKLDRLVGPKR
jgi:hypothetical protein